MLKLQPYACLPEQSRGRRFPEPSAPTRTPFQRDRDRIVHSTAFRRLVYKTQVFINHEGDLFRTRLTHSLEVAQLGRSMARTLGLNEDLVETIALAHDLGHTPFGHAGQDALHECMAAHGGFEHNLQSLRVVDHLEARYPGFDGLNLCFESREGILKHCSRNNASALEKMEASYPGQSGGVAQRFLNGGQPSLEAQLCNLADEIAYNCHDIDDGVRSGLLSMDQMLEVPLFRKYADMAAHQHPELAQAKKQRRWLYETIRLMLSDMVYDVMDATRAQLDALKPVDVSAVRAAPSLVLFSDGMRAQTRELKHFLFKHLYRHEQVMDTMGKAKLIVAELFDAYVSSPEEMHQDDDIVNELSIQRQVSDYIAGMTDRFALREHERLTGRRMFDV
ncbi:MAG: deoxyguanosinetriphosphate triphosphohydrolase [Curvibacter sp.]|nr:MAG: deoxyguanosinetriphosphate triphosphohydrolase [Curvibacter sp.]